MLSSETDLTVEIKEVVALEKEAASLLEQAKATQDRIDIFWSSVKNRMVETGTKSLKGDFGSITIAERLSFTATDELAPKYFKKVPDVKKIAAEYKLKGVAPKGATPKVTQYLTKRLK